MTGWVAWMLVLGGLGLAVRVRRRPPRSALWRAAAWAGSGLALAVAAGLWIGALGVEVGLVVWLALVPLSALAVVALFGRRGPRHAEKPDGW
ncbi:hypothetical protein CCR85_14175 [Rhodothalassium salexigens]|uniref:hypothetical protein n=1 Tax=Rhodothalassium salexigens TaxID=1086 RepID=UPI0019134A59|nr:hypothetical protein [Rhodothalassium salexigens]MBK5912631.1 hypothetical protein [Rhodothalassium salexigens]MBK5919589.1 hypothetical protein [Rhodothalassium salexigens]